MDPVSNFCSCYSAFQLPRSHLGRSVPVQRTLNLPLGQMEQPAKEGYHKGKVATCLPVLAFRALHHLCQEGMAHLPETKVSHPHSCTNKGTGHSIREDSSDTNHGDIQTCQPAWVACPHHIQGTALHQQDGANRHHPMAPIP